MSRALLIAVVGGVIGLASCQRTVTSGPGSDGAGVTAATEVIPERDVPVTTLRPIDLWNQYEVDPIRADAAYSGKWVALSPCYPSFSQQNGRSRLGFSVVTGEVRYPPGVIAFIRPGAQSPFTMVEPKKPIKVIALCKGRREAADAWHSFVVELEYAEFVEVVKAE